MIFDPKYVFFLCLAFDHALMQAYWALRTLGNDTSIRYTFQYCCWEVAKVTRDNCKCRFGDWSIETNTVKNEIHYVVMKLTSVFFNSFEVKSWEKRQVSLL